MKILMIGANGTIGKAAYGELSKRKEIISVDRTSGELHANLADSKSLDALFAQITPVDAIVCAAGNVTFAPLAEMDEAKFQLGLQDKLMGQVNLVQKGISKLKDSGSITLIGGILAGQPIRQGASASMVNAALEGFIRAAAIELPRGIRINLISPTVLEEALDSYEPYFRGFDAVPASRVAKAFSKLNRHFDLSTSH